MYFYTIKQTKKTKDMKNLTTANTNTEGLSQSHLNYLSKLSEISTLEQIKESLALALYETNFCTEVSTSFESIKVLISNAKAELKRL